MAGWNETEEKRSRFFTSSVSLDAPYFPSDLIRFAGAARYFSRAPLDEPKARARTRRKNHLASYRRRARKAEKKEGKHFKGELKEFGNAGFWAPGTWNGARCPLLSCLSAFLVLLARLTVCVSFVPFPTGGPLCFTFFIPARAERVERSAGKYRRRCAYPEWGKNSVLIKPAALWQNSRRFVRPTAGGAPGNLARFY